MIKRTHYKIQEEPSQIQYLVHSAARPFLKWAGGKGQLLNKFQEFYPKQLKQKKIKTFYEPFLGSGAVFFDIAQNYNIESAYLYDINEELILTYKVIQKEVYKLVEFLYHYEKIYLSLNKKKDKSFTMTRELIIIYNVSKLTMINIQNNGFKEQFN